MSILTQRQQLELNKAIVQYLRPIIDPGVLDTLTTTLETSVESTEDVIPNYLEKKWSTVLRLQKRIIDLENDINNYKLAMARTSSPNRPVLKDKINWLPLSAPKTLKAQSHQLIQAVALHPELPMVYCGCSEGSLISWNLVNDDVLIPDKIVRAHSRGLNKLAWSNVPLDLNSGRASYVLATCSADLAIKIWDGSTNQQIRTLSGHEHTVSAVAFSQVKPHILYSVSRDKNVKIWDLVTGYCLKSFIGHSDWVRDIDVLLLLQPEKQPSELGDFILTCSNDQSVRLSHAESGTGVALLIGHTHVVETVKFLPLHSNYYLDKYLVENPDSFPNLSSQIVEDLTYDNVLGFKYCVSAGRDNTVKLWLLPPPVLRPHRSPLPSQQNNSQGWLVADLIGHQSWVKALCVHPNGRFILSAGDDKTIRVWDLSTLSSTKAVQCIKVLSGHEGFINDLNFATLKVEETAELKKEETDLGKEKSKEEIHKELLLVIESRMRCLMVSGGVDSAVKVWS